MSSELETLEKEFDIFMDHLAKILSLHPTDLVDKRQIFRQPIAMYIVYIDLEKQMDRKTN